MALTVWLGAPNYNQASIANNPVETMKQVDGRHAALPVVPLDAAAVD
jgi:hypothetical protein